MAAPNFPIYGIFRSVNLGWRTDYVLVSIHPTLEHAQKALQNRSLPGLPFARQVDSWTAYMFMKKLGDKERVQAVQEFTREQQVELLSWVYQREGYRFFIPQMIDQLLAQ